MLTRGADDHETDGGPYAVLRGSRDDVRCSLLNVSARRPIDPHTADELRRAALAVDAGETRIVYFHTVYEITD